MYYCISECTDIPVKQIENEPTSKLQSLVDAKQIPSDNVYPFPYASASLHSLFTYRNYPMRKDSNFHH